MVSDELVDTVLIVRQSLYDKRGIVLVTPNRMETQNTLEALVILQKALERLDVPYELPDKSLKDS